MVNWVKLDQAERRKQANYFQNQYYLSRRPPAPTVITEVAHQVFQFSLQIKSVAMAAMVRANQTVRSKSRQKTLTTIIIEVALQID